MENQKHNTPDRQGELEKKVKNIAQYLGCNENELWNEMSKLLASQHGKVVEMIEGMNKDYLWAGTDDDEKDWVVKKIENTDLSGADVSIGYNQALTDILEKLKYNK